MPWADFDGMRLRFGKAVVRHNKPSKRKQSNKSVGITHLLMRCGSGIKSKANKGSLSWESLKSEASIKIFMARI